MRGTLTLRRYTTEDILHHFDELYRQGVIVLDYGGATTDTRRPSAPRLKQSEIEKINEHEREALEEQQRKHDRLARLYDETFFLTYVQIPGKGNCMFQSIAVCLLRLPPRHGRDELYRPFHLNGNRYQLVQHNSTQNKKTIRDFTCALRTICYNDLKEQIDVIRGAINEGISFHTVQLNTLNALLFDVNNFVGVPNTGTEFVRYFDNYLQRFRECTEYGEMGNSMNLKHLAVTCQVNIVLITEPTRDDDVFLVQHFIFNDKNTTIFARFQNQHYDALIPSQDIPKILQTIHTMNENKELQYIQY